MRLGWISALYLFATFLGFLFPTPSIAQYLYLDSNGDGIHDASDVLHATGTTQVDIWIVTNESRDGSPATCVSDPTYPLSILSYEVILHAKGGTVAYGAFENLVPEWNVSFGTSHDDLDLYVGRGGLTIKPPGRYHLGKILIEPRLGRPSIVVSPSTNLQPVYETAFGSNCPGTDNYNTMILGQEWTDADGLAAEGVSGSPPSIAFVAGVHMQDGTTTDRTIVATDADSDPLTLAVTGLPPYASFQVTSSIPGRIEGKISLVPSRTDVGNVLATIECSDGVSISIQHLSVVVVHVNRPPVFDPVFNLDLPLGTDTLQVLTARDADGDSLSMRLASAPGFARLRDVHNFPGVVEGTVELVTTLADSGNWTVTVEARDGVAVGIASFSVNVYDSARFHPPQLDSIPDFSLGEGETATYPIAARDPDGDFLLLFVDGPIFVNFDYDRPTYGWGAIDQELTIRPAPGDAGNWTATVIVKEAQYDQPFSAHRTFHVTVSDREFPPRVSTSPSTPCVEQGEIYAVDVAVVDPDGDPVTATFGPPPSWGSASDPTETRRRYVFAPTSDDPPQVFSIAVTAIDANGARSEYLVPIPAAAPGNCDRGGGSFAGSAPHPVPDAGGPYSGVAGAIVRLDGSGSVPGSNALLRYEWSFGDGTAGLGRALNHRYQEGGTYRAVLSVWMVEANKVERDTAVVTVRDALPARAFLAPEQRPIVTRARQPALTIRLECVGEEYALEDIVPTSLCLLSQGHGTTDSISSTDTKSPKIADRDRNGVPELALVFSNDDVKRLFANVRGRHDVECRVQGRLGSGAYVRAAIVLDVLGTPVRGVSVSPNPLNPTGVIAFGTTRAGRVTVRLFDVNGRLVRTLMNQLAPAGEVRVPIDGVDAQGRPLASGVYYYRVETTDDPQTGRVTILK